MVSVKIECGCGQHYAFDVEPVNRQMPSAVACPICGADGTANANAIIASKLPPPYTRPPAPESASAPPAKRSQVRVVVPAREPAAVPAGVKVGAGVLGLVDHSTAEIEARAKISWGDAPNDVINFLMLQGFSAGEAKTVVDKLFKERLAALRVKGITKIATGFGAMCVPLVAWTTFRHIGYFSLRGMGVSVLIALWGFWQLLNGIIMLVAPKMESGRDVAE